MLVWLDGSSKTHGDGGCRVEVLVLERRKEEWSLWYVCLILECLYEIFLIIEEVSGNIDVFWSMLCIEMYYQQFFKSSVRCDLFFLLIEQSVKLFNIYYHDKCLLTKKLFPS